MIDNLLDLENYCIYMVRTENKNYLSRDLIMIRDISEDEDDEEYELAVAWKVKHHDECNLDIMVPVKNLAGRIGYPCM